MTYDDALTFWYGRINYEIRSARPADLKLERMRALLRQIGDPHERFRIVHITGTKGKGSTAAMLAAVLREAGYTVGLFTSPHLSDVRERIQVNGVPITREELAARMAEVVPVVTQFEATDAVWPAPTFFEIGTALGFLHFCPRRCDVAVVEVGLGGRFDSTNVCRPVASVVTNVGLDHIAQLGTTIEEIAFQKAGIIKRGVPVVSGVTQEGPRHVIERVARDEGSPLHQIGRAVRPFASLGAYDFTTGAWTKTRLGFYRSRYHWPELHVNLLGEHQVTNASLAVATVEVLRSQGMPILDRAVVRGLDTVHWPARFEVLGERPFVVLDAAHNVPSVLALIATLRQCFVGHNGRKRIVFAVSSDKQYTEMLHLLGEYFDEVHLCRYGNNPRCVPPERLAKMLKESGSRVRSHVHATSAEAWAAARAASTPNDILCVAGSVFLAGELRPRLVSGA